MATRGGPSGWRELSRLWSASAQGILPGLSALDFHLKRRRDACISSRTDLFNSNLKTVPGDSPNSAPPPRPRPPTILAAGLLLAALALVVLYTGRRAFLSPVALVVVAAIGMAALLLQLRLRGDLRATLQASTVRGRLWLNGVGVLFAVGAVFADVLHLDAAFMLVAALAAVVAFAVSGILVLSALRKHHS